MAGELGFEPRLTESESAVLPLNYSPILACGSGRYSKSASALLLRQGDAAAGRLHLGQFRRLSKSRHEIPEYCVKVGNSAGGGAEARRPESRRGVDRRHVLLQMIRADPGST